jgi:hypothetical protein
MEGWGSNMILVPLENTVLHDLLVQMSSSSRHVIERPVEAMFWGRGRGYTDSRA